MLAALTTNVTRFFREPHHFDHLKEKVLPPLLAGAKRGGSVRIWSAGCSNGSEAYSIGLTILSLSIVYRGTVSGTTPLLDERTHRPRSHRPRSPAAGIGPRRPTSARPGRSLEIACPLRRRGPGWT